MENSPNSIEMQIDNFLEHFKRSASKAMDSDWTTTVVSSTGTINDNSNESILNTSSATNLLKSQTRSSCLDISSISEFSDNDAETTLTETQHQIFSNNYRSTTSIETTDLTTTSSAVTTPSWAQYQQYQQQQYPHIHQHQSIFNHQSIPNSYTNSSSYITNFVQQQSSNQQSGGNFISTSNNISNGQSNDDMLNIADVADLLHPQHIIITGGRSNDGCPLIIFPDNNNFQLLEDHEYKKLILYLTSVPSMQDADLGFHLIIDRRKDRWASVKAVLLKISVYFPGIIHVVYVLRPSGFLQKAISEVSSKFFKEEFRFRLVICSSLEDLCDHIDKSQLTQDMGGTLIYSHHEWIQRRISLEKFSSLTHQVSSDLDVFIQRIHDTEFPNSVEATQKLLDEQGAEYGRLKDEILSAAKHGESLLENMKSNDDTKEFSERTGNVSSIERHHYEAPLIVHFQEHIYHNNEQTSEPLEHNLRSFTSSPTHSTNHSHHQQQSNCSKNFNNNNNNSNSNTSHNKLHLPSSQSLSPLPSQPPNVSYYYTLLSLAFARSFALIFKSFTSSAGNTNTIQNVRSNCCVVAHQQMSYYDDCRDYHRLLVQLEETERKFDEFWLTRQTRLKQCLELRRFEQDFRELQSNFDVHLKTVSEMTEVGDSVARVDSLIKETKAFSKICYSDIERAEEVISAGKQLIGCRGGAYPKEVVQPKCEELSRVCDIINERLVRRLETLSKNRELMERIEKANMWCAKGVELLASQRIEKCSISAEIAEQSLQEIQQFISSASEFKLSSPREFKNIFQESTTPETKALVTQVLQRINDVSMMCDTRIGNLKKLTLKAPRPVQTVTPEPAVPLQPPGGAPHLFRRRIYSKIDGHDIRPRSMEGAIDSGVSISGDTGSSPDSDVSGQNQSNLEAKRLQRGHVLTELLETERIYVSEMHSILKGYRDAMLSEEMSSLVPPSLQGKEDILFGNLEELYKFHSDVFLKDLENCISTTELVALCFVQRRDTFYRLYSFYCQNIPRSERLRETLVDTHLFLHECQKRLGHKLPLAAYLLKPVQRITKYQLLLKELLTFSDSGKTTIELQKALNCMLVVLKCVNDSMHQIAITGFPADLSQQGELLLQDSFQVWTESKKDIRLRLKTQQRHIFLYQKVMLFCKQGSKTGHNKSTYQFKHYLKMSQIGLTESVRGDSRRFEVWLQGRQEVHTLQAPTIDIKNKWVAEIKRVLLNQLEELKGEKIKQYGLNNRQLRQTASWDTSCSILSAPQRTINCDTSNEITSPPLQPSSVTIINGGNRVANVTTSSSAPLTNITASQLVSEDINHHYPNQQNQSQSNQQQTTVAVSGNSGGCGGSSSVSDKDNQEASGWSSDYSNSEDELSIIEDNSTPGGRFIALADYCAVGHSEVSMKEGDTVELLKVGCAGWWFVKSLDSNIEGWTPAAYLEPINRKTSRSSSRNQDRLN